MIQQRDETTGYRIYVVNGVFVSGGIGTDGRVLPPRLFAALAERIAAVTGWRATALWPYASKRDFGIPAFASLTRRATVRYAAYLATSIRADIAADPLRDGETVALVAYSGGVPIAQTAATLLRPSIPVGAFVFVGPALIPSKVPRDWAGGGSIGCVLGERDWVQGVFPRLPRPWQSMMHPRTDARLRAALPIGTRYRTLPCDHWPGYFTAEMWPPLVNAVCDLMRTAAVPADIRA